jgi:hypothetical protein
MSILPDFDEDGFSLEHTSYGTHTLPDDVHDWGCQKADCHTSIRKYATKAEARLDGFWHEYNNGAYRVNGGRR